MADNIGMIIVEGSQQHYLEKKPTGKKLKTGFARLFPFFSSIEMCTEMRFNLCKWLGEDSSCSCLTVLPGPARVLLNKICKE